MLNVRGSSSSKMGLSLLLFSLPPLLPPLPPPPQQPARVTFFRRGARVEREGERNEPHPKTDRPTDRTGEPKRSSSSVYLVPSFYYRSHSSFVLFLPLLLLLLSLLFVIASLPPLSRPSVGRSAVLADENKFMGGNFYLPVVLFGLEGKEEKRGGRWQDGANGREYRERREADACGGGGSFSRG